MQTINALIYLKMTERVNIIAEIGSNYDSDLETAKKYILAAKDSGADTVKFQTLRKSKLITPKVRQNEEWVEHPAWKIFSNLELPDKWHFTLKEFADTTDIEFISTPFYLEAVDLLETIGVSRYKIASGDITFFPLLKKVGETGKPVILSTGGSNLFDVENAVEILNHSGAGQITLLHCVASYPPQFNEMNLRAITTLKNKFGLPVGISDHSPDNIVPLAAVALGASVVEKHLTFDRSLPGPDHPFAMTMPEFAEMVKQIRLLEKALGAGEKVPSLDELKRQHRFRRGVYDPETLEPVDGQVGLWLRPEHKQSF